MCAIDTAAIWTAVLFTAVIVGPLGFFTARVQVWWRKTAMSVRILKPVLINGSAVVIVLSLVGAVALRSGGWFG